MLSTVRNSTRFSFLSTYPLSFFEIRYLLLNSDLLPENNYKKNTPIKIPLNRSLLKLLYRWDLSDLSRSLSSLKTTPKFTPNSKTNITPLPIIVSTYL